MLSIKFPFTLSLSHFKEGEKISRVKVLYWFHQKKIKQGDQIDV